VGGREIAGDEKTGETFLLGVFPFFYVRIVVYIGDGRQTDSMGESGKT